MISGEGSTARTGSITALDIGRGHAARGHVSVLRFSARRQVSPSMRWRRRREDQALFNKRV
jgi:hypothetical protein